MKSKLKYYGLEGSSLEIKQGFAIINDIKTNKEFTQIATAMVGMEADLKMLHQRLDSLAAKDTLQKMDSACVLGTLLVSLLQLFIDFTTTQGLSLSTFVL